LHGRVVHLVDYDNYLLNTKRPNELYVFASLAVLLEASFVFTLASGNNESRIVSHCRAHNHVWDVIFVTRSIKNCKLFFGCVESGTTHLYRFAFGLLFLANIHDVGEPPGVSTLFLGLLLVLRNGSLVYAFHLKHNLSGDSTFTRVDVSYEHQRARFLVCLYSDN